MICGTCAADNPADRSACRICGTPLGGQPANPDALPPGTPLGGVYVLESPLGRGGLGITYRAWDTRLRRRVAIKEFFPEGCRRTAAGVQPPCDWTREEFEAARQQFLAEGQLLARFTQRGIAQVHYIFEERGTGYLVLEYVEGETLAARLRREGPLPVDEAVAVGEKALAALAEVHGAGVIHGDIKPENLLLCGDGRVVLVDFGSALGDDGKGRRGLWVTPAYAPLEQYAKTAPLGPYTDLYGLGATLYHALVGAPPPGAVDRARGVRLRKPVEVRPEVPRPLSEAICQALAMEVRHRPASAAEFADELRRALPTPPGDSGATPGQVQASSAGAAAASGAGSRSPGVIRFLLACLPVILWSVFITYRHQRANTARPEARSVPAFGSAAAPPNAAVAMPPERRGTAAVRRVTHSPEWFTWTGDAPVVIRWSVQGHSLGRPREEAPSGQWRRSDGASIARGLATATEQPDFRWTSTGNHLWAGELRLRVPADVLVEARRSQLAVMDYYLSVPLSDGGTVGGLVSVRLSSDFWQRWRLVSCPDPHHDPRPVRWTAGAPCTRCRGEGWLLQSQSAGAGRSRLSAAEQQAFGDLLQSRSAGAGRSRGGSTSPTTQPSVR